MRSHNLIVLSHEAEEERERGGGDVRKSERGRGGEEDKAISLVRGTCWYVCAGVREKERERERKRERKTALCKDAVSHFSPPKIKK